MKTRASNFAVILFFVAWAAWGVTIFLGAVGLVIWIWRQL